MEENMDSDPNSGSDSIFEVSAEGEDYGIWDFEAVRNFSRAFDSHCITDSICIETPIPDVSKYDPKSDEPTHLGDFDRLLRFCGKPVSLPTPQIDLADSSSQRSEFTTPPSSATEDNNLHSRVEHFDDFVGRSVKTVQWKDEVGRQKRQKNLENTASLLDPAEVARLLTTSLQEISDVDLVNSPTPKSDRKLKLRKGGPLSSALKTSTPLLPHSILPPAEDINPSLRPLASYLAVSHPLSIRLSHPLPNNKQKAALVKKLSHKLGNTSNEDYTKAVQNLASPTDPKGIHIFVDLSNIVIGYNERFRLNNGIPLSFHMKGPSISFASLALILERGRKVARRILVGSTSTAAYTENTKQHKHVAEAESFGYELNILERVSKPIASTPARKKRNGSGTGYATSGNSSASESGVLPRLKVQEQAVDELLQMKMLESIVDTEVPTTIVLASGDAAEAEFSGGFLKNVERALAKGWKVEIVAWKNGLSNEYRTLRCLPRWKGRLVIIELDEFCPEMRAVHTEKDAVPIVHKDAVTGMNI